MNGQGGKTLKKLCHALGILCPDEEFQQTQYGFLAGREPFLELYAESFGIC